MKLFNNILPYSRELVEAGAFKRVGDSSCMFSPIQISQAQGNANFTPTLNTVIAWPFLIQKDIFVESISVIQVAAYTGANSSQIAIYNSDDNFYPTSLLKDFGTNSGASGFKTLNGNITPLKKGFYFFAFNSNQAIQLRRLNDQGTALVVLGKSISGSDLVNNYGWQTPYTYGTMPDYFPKGASFYTTVPIPIFGFGTTKNNNL